MPSGLKEHTDIPIVHKTVHSHNSSVNESKYMYATLQSTTKVQRSTKHTFGSSARLSSGSLFTNGLHGPWIDGQSVCHIFLSLIIWFPDCVRIKFTHLTTSSREWLWQFTRCLSPFTRTENKYSNGDGMGYSLSIYLHHVISIVQKKNHAESQHQTRKMRITYEFFKFMNIVCAVD